MSSRPAADGRGAVSEPRVAHWPELDGLRGLAILLVIPHNADTFSSPHGAMVVAAMAAHAGWLGVQLFFVLSGFLITHNLLATRGATNYFSAFFARRVLRIFPLYYLTLVFFLLVLPLVTTLPREILDSYGRQGSLWIFLSNWNVSAGGSVYWFPHFWSLAVEEQFYLVWPFVILGLKQALLVPFVLSLVVAANVCRVTWMHAGVAHHVIYIATLCRMDALACGALAAILMRGSAFPALARRYATTVLFGAAGLLAAIGLLTRLYATDEPAMMLGGYTGIALAMALVLIVCVAGESTGAGNAVRRLCSLAPLRSVGKVSYAMYVFHLPLFLVLKPTLVRWLCVAGDAGPLLVALVMIALSYLAGSLSYVLIERPFLRLKRLFQPQAAVREPR